MKNKDYNMIIKCDNFTKKDWEENWLQIIEQIESELVVGVRELFFDIKNWIAEVREVIGQ